MWLHRADRDPGMMQREVVRSVDRVCHHEHDCFYVLHSEDNLHVTEGVRDDVPCVQKENSPVVSGGVQLLAAARESGTHSSGKYGENGVPPWA